ncbi:HlyD family secretion protein [Bradyrhizobium sp. UFLA 03-164]|uniref:HlyD family secretion protein n=2 Tax=Bradyrhizobium uaiense TaxID=2594946 RepID=A0A6P1BA52_9BRAD|nr:HlyD family secretion protein [Bradyrhizobium uaiense]
MVGLAIAAGSAAWNTYMERPWTRDATVRAYVVTMAPEVSGRIVELPVADNQFVHKGDLLMIVDPTDYRIGVSLAAAAVDQAKATAVNAAAESRRRQQLSDLATTPEEKQSYAAAALAAQASYQHASASLDQANVNLKRTRILSPAEGYVTNLLVQLGDYVNVGQKAISVVNAETFWVDGYFEETSLSQIHEADAAAIKLLSYRQVLRGHVESISRGINVPNARPDAGGLATVNPVFTWVRLAQRVPVRLHIDEVPPGVRLVVGMTATVEISSRPRSKQAPD